MPASLLTLNTTIPSVDHPGSPVLIIYENGDWEVAFSGDVDYIREGNNSYHSHHTYADIFVGTMIFFEMGDEDDLDVSDGIIYFQISETIDQGGEEEPVLLIYSDGEIDVIERYHAEQMIFNDPTMEVVQNFVPLLDVFEDFRTFRGQHEEMMFGVGMDEDDEEDEDE